MKTNAAGAFKQTFGLMPDVIVRSPGRVNIIGEHTDYLGGLCLPMAVNLTLFIAVSRDSNLSRLRRGADSVLVSSSHYSDITPQEVSANTNGVYARLSFLIAALNESGISFPNAKMHICGNLPIGVGLSSSAAFTAGALASLSALFQWNLDEESMIGLCIKAEHRAGTPCGYMDPAAVIYGKKGHAIYIDCFNEEHEAVELITSGYSWLLVDSGVARDLSDGRYAALRSRMENAASTLTKLDSRIEHPRYLDLVSYMSGRSSIPKEYLPFLDHFYLENERVKTFISAIEMGNVVQAGSLLFDSQASLTSNLTSNIPETDWIIEQLGANDKCLGARVTGAGFGGAVIALVESDDAIEIGNFVAKKGSQFFSKPMMSAIVMPDSGIEVIER